MTQTIDLSGILPTVEPPDEETDRSDDSGQRLCACGCGTILPESYKWSYKRGHKLNAIMRGVDPDPDPDSNVSIPARVRTKVPKKIRDDIEGQLGFLLGISAGIVSARDPICGDALTSNLDKIASAMTPIVCKSSKLVEYMTRGGGLIDYIALGAALQPVITTVVSHHITRSIQTDTDGPIFDNYNYPVGE